MSRELEFYEEQLSDSHSLFTGLREFLPIISILIDPFILKFGTEDLHVMPFGLGGKFHVFINLVSNGDKRPSSVL